MAAPPPSATSWKVWAILALPLLGTAPGFLLHRQMAHFYFPAELATNLLLIAWAVVLHEAITDRRDAAMFHVGAGATIAVVSLYAVLQGVGLLARRSGEPDDPRVMGTFGSPNVLAAFLIPLLPLFLVFAARNITQARTRRTQDASPARERRDGRGGGRRVPSVERARPRSRADGSAHRGDGRLGWALAAAVLFVIGAVALFLAQSRMGVLAWCGSGGIVVALCYRRSLGSPGAFLPSRQSIAAVALLVIGAGLGLAALRAAKGGAYEGYAKRVAAVSTFRGWSARTVPWNAALTSIREAPVFGYGLGSSYELFFEHVSPLSRAYADGRSFAHAHSEALEVLEEGGILGALLTLALFAFLIRAAVIGLRRNRGDPFVRDLSIAVLAGIAGYAASAALTESSRMIGAKLALYTLFGFALSLPNLGSQPADGGPEAPIRSRRPILGSALLLVMVLASLGVLAPFLRSMRTFAEMAAQSPSEPLMRKIDSATGKDPNPYSLFYLADWQVKSGKYADAHGTLARIQSLIPHYRESDYLEAYLAFSERNFEAARSAGEKALDRDRYYQPTLALLTTVAAATRDSSLAFEQLSALSEWAAIRSGISRHGREGIELSKDPRVSGIEVRASAGKTQIVWNADLVAGILRWRISALGGWDYSMRERFHAWLDKECPVRGLGDLAGDPGLVDAFAEQVKSGVIRLVQ